MTQTIKNAIIGAAGFTASSVAPDAIPFDPSLWGQVMQVATQIVIAVVTLISLFKKKN